jgi:hypothetical protein
MFRLVDTFAIDTTEILFEKGNEYIILLIRRNKINVVMKKMRA